MAAARPIGAVALCAAAVLYTAYAGPQISGREAAVIIALLVGPLIVLWR
jgi:hypothetical protein